MKSKATPISIKAKAQTKRKPKKDSSSKVEKKTGATKGIKARTAPSRIQRGTVSANADAKWTLGRIISANSRISKAFEGSIDELRNHTLICGNTGSGKTNTCFNLLEEVWKNKIPFLVIEPAKSEYRHLLMNSTVLKDSAKIYTLADDSLAPFQINPFELAKGVHVQSHIDALLAIFDASFEMYAPMPQVLMKALCSVYEARGWDLLLNRNLRLEQGVNPGDADCPAAIYPTMKDLYESIDTVVESFGYSERIGPDVLAALRARIGSLVVGAKGQVFNCRASAKAQNLFHNPCILELSDKFNSSEKSFLTGLLMLFLHENLKARGAAEKLEHLLLIDDAHRLLKRESRSSRSEYQPFVPMVSGIFANLLSESSAYGQGIVISSQTPAGLTPEILSNTNLRIVHRLISEDDLNAIAAPSFLNDKNRRQIVSLNTGNALFFDKGMSELQEVSIDFNKYKESIFKTAAIADQLLVEFLSKDSKTNPISVFDMMSSLQLKESDSSRTLIEASTLVADDSLFRQTFNRYVMSTATDLTKLVHMRTEIIHEIQRILGGRVRGNLTEITWCSLLMASERYFERKGEEHFWSFEEEERQKLKWLKLMKPAFQPSEVNRRLDITVLREWRDNLRHSQMREQGPFSSCAACQAKCFYRFEVSELTRDPKLKFDFNSSINNNERPASDSVAWFCRLLCERLIGQFDLELAFCLAVHFVRDQQLSSDAQLVLLEKTRKFLEASLSEETKPEASTEG